jgi:gentisate 1,2-dioxygenase
MWETGFVPDLLTFDHLQLSNARGTGSTNIMFVLADATLHAHMSEIPSGYYKKAHRHVDGFHIFQLSGHGYSLYWYEGGPVERVDWGYGTLHGPPLRMWHQHFNLSDEPARYMAVAMGSIRYPFTAANMASWKRLSEAHNEDQIEYDSEDPAIAGDFQEELARQAVAGS